jgi:phage shock protein E
VNSTFLIAFLIADIIIVSLILTRVFGQVSEARARELVQRGALLLDVRTPEEFRSGHLRGAVNVPYQEVGQRIVSLAPDKSSPVLVYCLSGGRSGIAKSNLRRLGYAEAHNLGSLKRARKIVEG